MPQRIDFALEPGVILFAVLFFVLLNVLIAVVVYPYFRDQPADGKPEQSATGPAEDFIEGTPANQPTLEQRVDEFIEDMERHTEG